MHLSSLFKIIIVLLLLAMPTFSHSAISDPVSILILGDSLTAGYGLEQNDAFPAQLEASLLSSGYRVKIINAGVSGDTSAGGLARLDWALADSPAIVIIALGANDAIRGLDPTNTYQNIDQIISRLKSTGCLVILTGMKAPRNLGPDYYNRFDQIYPDLAMRHNLLFYPFFLEGVAAVPELNQADGIHPNPAGVNMIVSKIQPLVLAALDSLKSSIRHD